MRDPLERFDWSTLYARYDRLSKDFKSTSLALRIFQPRPKSERQLYSRLLEQVSDEKNRSTGISLETYEAVLYWKYYSQPLALKICDHLRNHSDRSRLQAELTNLSQLLPTVMTRDKIRILEQIGNLGNTTLPGIVSYEALPTRTTLLHMIYPEVVPIFDKMVLKAVGAWDNSYANRSRKRFKKYLEHVWQLVDRYRYSFPPELKETPIRLIDMALWVIRDGYNDS